MKSFSSKQDIYGVTCLSTVYTSNYKRYAPSCSSPISEINVMISIIINGKGKHGASLTPCGRILVQGSEDVVSWTDFLFIWLQINTEKCKRKEKKVVMNECKWRQDERRRGNICQFFNIWVIGVKSIYLELNFRDPSCPYWCRHQIFTCEQRRKYEKRYIKKKTIESLICGKYFK